MPSHDPDPFAYLRRQAMRRGGSGGPPSLPLLVADRMGFPSRTVGNTGTTGGGTATQFEQQMTVNVPRSARYITFRFGNHISNASTLSTLDVGPSNLTLRMGAANTGACIPGYVNNDGVTRDIVLAPGEYVNFTVDRGTTTGSTVKIITRGTFASVPINWPAADILMTEGTAFNEFGTALTDRTTSNWTSGTRTTNYAIMPPIAIFDAASQTRGVGVMIIGDSISAAGNNDTTFGPAIGWAQRGLRAAGQPWGEDGAQGMTLSALMANATQRLRRIDALDSVGLTHILCPLGTNDFSGGSTAAQLQTNFIALNAYCAARAIKLIPATAPPRTDSTNTAKYGPDSASVWGYIQTHNTWVRTNPFGNGYFDAASYLADSGNPNLWRTDLGTPTSDGIHPNTALHTATAAALTAQAATLFV